MLTQPASTLPADFRVCPRLMRRVGRKIFPSTLPPLMTCRYCLRYALGYCVRRGGKRPQWREPLHLVLPDGRQFRLEFDCQDCQMNVYAEK